MLMIRNIDQYVQIPGPLQKFQAWNPNFQIPGFPGPCCISCVCVCVYGYTPFHTHTYRCLMKKRVGTKLAILVTELIFTDTKILTKQNFISTYIQK